MVINNKLENFAGNEMQTINSRPFLQIVISLYYYFDIFFSVGSSQFSFYGPDCTNDICTVNIEIDLVRNFLF
jgi:hypothetical protein